MRRGFKKGKNVHKNSIFANVRSPPRPKTLGFSSSPFFCSALLKDGLRLDKHTFDYGEHSYRFFYVY